MDVSDRSAKRPFIILGASVVLLTVLVALSLNSGVFGNSLHIDKLIICLELDENRMPLRVSDSIPYGPRQICLWLQYASAREGSHLEVSWYYGKERVLSEPFKLMKKDGVKAFYLLREAGTPLPPGKYKVVVSTVTGELSNAAFEILKR